MGNTSASEDNFCDLFLFLEFSVKVFLKKKKEREKRGKKGFHFDSRRLPGRRERKCENRGKASQFCVFVMLDMCSVTSLVKSFSI